MRLLFGSLRFLFVFLLSAAFVACSTGGGRVQPGLPDGDGDPVVDGGDARGDAAPEPASDASLDPDAACVATTVGADVERAPVDIIWMVDNSISMEPAIREVTRGLNDFAARIASSGIDYRVILLALRGMGRVSFEGSPRYAVCIPEPLAGDASCGNGERFFHSSVDIRSTRSTFVRW